MLGKILPAVALGGGVALLWPELSWRVDTLKLVTADVATLQSVTTFKEQQIKHQDLLKNCEDVIVLEDRGVAILSCDPQRDAWNTVMGTFIDPSQPGAIFQWFYSDPSAFPQPLALEGFGGRGGADFHPLGIEYHEDSSTLLVVNHASTGPTVEVFDYVPWGGFGRASAQHRASVAHPAIWTPNSVHALNATSFLLTNDHAFRARERFVLHKLETYAALPLGNVVHVTLPAELPAAAEDDNGNRIPLVLDGPDDGVSVTTVASGIPFANGVALLNRSTLAVASTTGHSLKLFDLSTSEADGAVSLTHRTDVRAPALLDNLSVDAQGRLLAAGHPRPGALSATVAFRASCLQLRAKAQAIALVAEQEVEKKLGEDEEQQPLMDEIADATTKKTVEVVMAEAEKALLERCAVEYDQTSPSWVAELVFDEQGEPGWKEVYVGSEFGSSTTAARDTKEGVMLVVGLYEKGVLVAKE